MVNKVKPTKTLEGVVIRFVGDSGDGMQLTGTQFTETSALMGNDLSTFPDYPSEIRAPAGTLAGVSGFQINFSSHEVHTHGDAPDVLVAMNPAALKVSLPDLKLQGIIIVDTSAFNEKGLEKASYTQDPLADGSLSGYRVFPVDITGLTVLAIAELGLGQKDATRCKNFFALGLVYYLFSRPLDHSEEWIEVKFRKKNSVVADANLAALKAGYNYGHTTEIFTTVYQVRQAPIEPGRYRNVTGNEALALGLVTASELSGLDLFLGSYPITPASEILHFLSNLKHLGVKTVQAEDEIAGICAAIGAAYSGALAATTTSGPGMALKTEALGLACMLELPLVICNVQRGGPSTGLPTKTEQSDLFQALFGRNGECPIPVISASSPGDCYWAAIEAARIAVRHMTPVILLTDGYLANGAEPWRIPQIAEMEPIEVEFPTNPETFKSYSRDAELARPWALPGTPGLEHRVGGLEKEHLSGNVCYDGDNHQFMSELRAKKVARVAEHIPATKVFGAESGDLVVIGWGGTFGAIRSAVRSANEAGEAVGHVHLRHLNPLPRDLGAVLGRFKRILVPELNLGQLSYVLKANYLRAVESLCKVKGKPFKEAEIADAIRSQLEAIR